MSTFYRNCRSCRGTGKVPNMAPAWLDYLEVDWDGEEGLKPEPVDCGPQYFDCAECEGKGIKLTAAGEEVAVLFRRLGMTFTPPRSRQLLNINTWYINNGKVQSEGEAKAG